MLKHKKILVFDFETTGLDPFSNQIIEIGAILLEKDESNLFVEKESYDVLVKADFPLPPKITQITNITNQMLQEKGMSQIDACQRLMQVYDEETLLIAYNIQFDLGFLQAFIRTHWNLNFKVKNDILDVMAIYKDRHPYPHRLESAVAHYKINVLNTHRALDDVKATYEVLKQMALENDNLDKYVNVLGYNPKYPVADRMRLPHVKYVAQYGGRKEIEKA
jgi:DNA polymerase III subunit epsilon